MKVVKFIWKIILNLAIVPLVLSIIVSVVVGFMTQSDNQKLENYQPSQENITRLKGDKIVAAPLAEPSFDAVGIAFLITFLVVFVFMIIYMISIRNDKKPAAQAEQQ